MSRVVKVADLHLIEADIQQSEIDLSDAVNEYSNGKRFPKKKLEEVRNKLIRSAELLNHSMGLPMKEGFDA